MGYSSSAKKRVKTASEPVKVTMAALDMVWTMLGTLSDEDLSKVSKIYAARLKATGMSKLVFKRHALSVFVREKVLERLEEKKLEEKKQENKKRG